MGELTLLLPTRNRAAFVKRSLDYYSQHGTTWKIVIGDSSDGGETRKTVEGFGERLNLDYHEFDPSITFMDKWISLAKLSDSDFVLSVADDDLIVIETVEIALEHLRNNPGYSATGGHSIYFQVEDDKIFGKIRNLSVDGLKDNHFEESRHRLHRQLGEYEPSWYSVHRREVFEEVIGVYELSKGCLDYWLPELIESSVTAIYGKIKRLPLPFVFRQIHRARTAVTASSNPQNVLEWLLADGAGEKIERFVEMVGDVLAKYSPPTGTEHLSRQDAQVWVRHFFWCYLAHAFQRPVTRPEDCGAGEPKVKGSWLSRLRDLFREKQVSDTGAGLDLEAISDPSHPFHGEFAELRRSVEVMG